MNFLQILAHGEELHTEETTAAEHWLTNPWILAALYAAVLLAIWFGLAKNKRLKTYRLMGIMLVSLIVAFAGYTFAPGLAATAIIIGFGSSLLLMVATANK